jgi:hypothetical protein
LSREGRGLRRLFSHQSGSKRPLQPDPPLAKPACRASPPGGDDPDCQRYASSFALRAADEVPSLAGYASHSASRSARDLLRRTLALTTALAVGVCDADTCGPPLSPGPHRRPSNVVTPPALYFYFLITSLFPLPKHFLTPNAIPNTNPPSYSLLTGGKTGPRRFVKVS